MIAHCRVMLRQSRKIGRSYAKLLLGVLTCASLIGGSAGAADLRLPPTPVAEKQVPSTDARKAKFEEFLRWLQKQNNQ
jgi:hypothetical protein